MVLFSVIRCWNPPPRIALGVVVVILLPVPLIINIIIGEVSWSGMVIYDNYGRRSVTLTHPIRPLHGS